MVQNPDLPEVTTLRTANQICGTTGDAYKCFVTDPVWVTKSDPYAMTDGNDVKPYLTGKEYFKALAAAIAAAEKSIYMLGWEINWDVHLIPGVRLYDAFLNAAKAKPALKIYVLPWAGAVAPPTYAKETAWVLESMNEQLGSKRVFVVLAKPHAQPSNGPAMFFSHHQKQVVIDEKIGFLGGMDVSYGRNDDASYGLSAASHQGTGNGTYNGCIPHTRAVQTKDYVDPNWIPLSDAPVGLEPGSAPNMPAKANKKLLHDGKVQYPEGGVELDPATQPRMPWQDVHLRLEGPIVSDLASNFVLRWNSASTSPRLALPIAPAGYAKAGTCQVQMLRSASGLMVDLEARSVAPSDRARVHEKFWHNHIYHAMMRLIEKADHFIYIENQFFTSAYGPVRFGDNPVGKPNTTSIDAAVSWWSANVGKKWGTRVMSGDGTAPPENLICTALGKKLRDVIMNMGNAAPDGKTSPFHVYITLPVHSEGPLNDPAVMTQVHYTMQSLVYAQQSLLNRIRRAIKARQLFDKDDKGYERVFKDGNLEYTSVPVDHCWPYITLLNLRNYEQLGDRYVTEQIYVHTKTMIVDDRFALIGSANINDRSLLGNRDSEIAVLIADLQNDVEDIGSTHGPQLTRKFARDLRMGIWNKLFGNTGAGGKGARPAAGLQDAIKRPVAQVSWERIRDLATLNTQKYDAAFPFIPANNRRIWPVTPMPFDNDFWTAKRHQPAASELKNIKGYITLLPWNWTEGEDNNSYYHSALFVNNTTKPANSNETVKTETIKMASNDSTPNKGAT
jgi:phospholipase D1/2